jgi:ribosomal protein S18 acetylase RimI-like enzyme
VGDCRGGEIRELSHADAASIDALTCSDPQDPKEWAVALEHTLRSGAVSEAIAAGHVLGWGYWYGGDLVGLITARKYKSPRIWRVSMLAIEPRCRRNGIAWALKTGVLDRAWADGAQAVDSKVHHKNGAMLELNRKLDAVVIAEDEPESPEDMHYHCIVRRPAEGYSGNS